MKLMKEFIKENKWIVLATTLTICLQIAGTLGVPKLVGKLIDVGIVSGDQQVIKTIGIQMLPKRVKLNMKMSSLRQIN